MTVAAPAHLAVRLECPLVPVRVERIRGARFRITCYPPVERVYSADRQDGTQTAIQMTSAITGSSVIVTRRNGARAQISCPAGATKTTKCGFATGSNSLGMRRSSPLCRYGRADLIVSRLSPQGRKRFAHPPDVIAFHREDSVVIKRRIVFANGAYKMAVFIEPSSRLLDLIAARHVRAGVLE